MSSEAQTFLVMIPALPLLAAIVTALFGKSILGSKAHYPVVAGIGASCVFSLLLLSQVVGAVEEAAKAAPDAPGWEATVDLWRWAQVNDAIDAPAFARPAPESPGAAVAALPAKLPFVIEITLRADALTCIMLSMVTFISTLVAIYASGYMHGDPGYARFFAYIGLFVFSMTMLVSGSNFVLLYVFWEAVGLCSYLLIGFWYQKPEAAAAGKKAFLVNRIGDFGFALGVFLIWTTYGTLNFHDAGGVAGVLGQTRLAHPDWYAGGGVATAICLLLMVGACGKSAQFPLHVWLPDAMEGPTPVSALIHAATMVTAGVYMVTRCTPLYVQSAYAQDMVAVIGCVTAAMAGYIALTQTDLKRVLAYSTVSQLGYMFLGVGTGLLAGVTAGMFHLFTHAFFKALLFLGAGSVMHAMGGVIDMRYFGGLRRLMPKTCWTFFVGSLALAGIFPLSGFWSKDAIMAAVSERAGESSLFGVLYFVALVTAGATAFYTFRAFIMTFFGPERVPPEAGHHAHESPPAMTVPLIILAVGAAGVGAYFEATHGFAEFLHHTPSLTFGHLVAEAHEVEHFHWSVAIVSTIVAVAGIGLAFFIYRPHGSLAQTLADKLRPLYVLSLGKLFFDQIYVLLFVLPLRVLAAVSYGVDRWLVDGLVNLCGKIPPWIGASLRSLQNGMVQFYALAMVLGVVVLMGSLLVRW